jgi:DNA-binding NarL/FixJ family response regulator
LQFFRAAQRCATKTGDSSMRNDTNPPAWAWDFYQAQQSAQTSRIDDPVEEAQSFIVHLIVSGKLPDSRGELERLINNHLAGGRQKVRRRAVLLQKTVAEDTIDETAIVESREWLARAQAIVTAAQWTLLQEIAVGRSYEEIAKSSGAPVGTVKSLVSRARAKLKCSRGLI